MSGQFEDSDPVLEALDALVRVGRDNVVGWMQLMERVDAVKEMRRQGVAYAQMPMPVDAPTIIDGVAENQERLTAAAATFRRALAAELAAAGMSHGQIARLFHVTRQRVAALLREPQLPRQHEPARQSLLPTIADKPAVSGGSS